MSNLQPAVIVLDKGLDLQTAKIIAPSGTVLDSLNYEQVDFQGQKRIEGYARYDGKHIPALDEYYRVEAVNVTVTDGLVYSTGGDLFGVVLDDTTDPDFVVLAVIDFNLIAPTGAVAGTDYEVTAAAHYTNLLAYTETLRTRVGTLTGRIIGLHWFRDRLYAIAGVTAVVVTLAGATPLRPDDVLSTGDTILDVVVVGPNLVAFISGTVNTYPAGTNLVVNGDVIATVSATPTTEEVASFFEARSEQQAIDESALSGWTFVHLGWRVMFVNGESLYGDLAALNQNRTGVGVQGPTSISGDNGRPLVLQQGVTITDGEPQVNGWKSSTTPTTYVLNPSDVAQIENIFTYADAYISWDGTTEEVEAPGSDMTGLVEYPATNSVVVEV